MQLAFCRKPALLGLLGKGVAVLDMTPDNIDLARCFSLRDAQGRLEADQCSDDKQDMYD